MDIKELIKLYKMYITDTVEERTMMMTDLKEGKNYGKKRPVEFKGDFEGFMRWLTSKYN